VPTGRGKVDEESMNRKELIHEIIWLPENPKKVRYQVCFTIRFKLFDWLPELIRSETKQGTI
jgi:hypothetical protein